jgi:formate dehydrogenase subunit gamma
VGNSFRFLVLVTLILSAGSCRAGEDVVPLDAAGKKLSPSQIDGVNVGKTCGECHDVADLASSVHFNRGSKSVDAESGSCLSCHLGAKKDAFTSAGLIRKTPAAPSESACLSCHSDMEPWTSHADKGAHKGMTCTDCHKNAGHRSTGAASCAGCHSGKTGAPKPVHFGIPKLHMLRLRCEACHVVRISGSVAPGLKLDHGVVAPVGGDGELVHHGVAGADSAFGSRGCPDCHSVGSRFFFGKTAGGEGQPAVPNYKALGQTRGSIIISAVRERFLKPISGWVFVAVILVSIAHYLVFGPRRTKASAADEEVQRFTNGERLVHLLALASFLLLGITGMAFLFHLESPGSILRELHGHIGPLFVLAIVGMLAIWWKNALFVSCDREWIFKLGGYLWIKGECPAEKFNAGQKLFYWLIVILGGAAISVTGIMLLAGRGHSPSWVYSVHDVAAVAVIGGIIGHAYLSILANPGTIHSMLTGRVKRTWAEHHHPNWLRRIEKTGEGGTDDADRR